MHIMERETEEEGPKTKKDRDLVLYIYIYAYRDSHIINFDGIFLEISFGDKSFLFCRSFVF
jgi:hypothetical protein